MYRLIKSQPFFFFKSKQGLAGWALKQHACTCALNFTQVHYVSGSCTELPNFCFNFKMVVVWIESIAWAYTTSVGPDKLGKCNWHLHYWQCYGPNLLRFYIEILKWNQGRKSPCRVQNTLNQTRNVLQSLYFTKQ